MEPTLIRKKLHITSDIPIKSEQSYMAQLRDITYLARYIYQDKNNNIRGYHHYFKIELITHMLKYRWEAEDISSITGIPASILKTWEYLVRRSILYPAREDRVYSSYDTVAHICEYSTYVRYATIVCSLMAYQFNLWYNQYIQLKEYVVDQQRYRDYITHDNCEQYIPYYILTLASSHIVDIKQTHASLLDQIAMIHQRVHNLSELYSWYTSTELGSSDTVYTVYVCSALPSIAELILAMYRTMQDPKQLQYYTTEHELIDTIIGHLQYGSLPITYHNSFRNCIYYADNTFFIVPYDLHLYIEHMNWDWEIVTLPHVNITTVPLDVQGKDIQDIVLQYGFDYIKVQPPIKISV